MTQFVVPSAQEEIQALSPRTVFEEDLWRRLESWNPDEQGSLYSFQDRLEQENGWSKDYARRAIDEYRKFLFLSQVAGYVVCPSEDVDQVWHLHLTYTRSYWDDLCRRILERPLHHQPTKGGSSEREHYVELYSKTLSSYARWFGNPPDKKLWPKPTDRFAPRVVRRVDLSQHLLIPRPWPCLRKLNASMSAELFRVVQWRRSSGAVWSGFLMLLIPAAITWGPLDWAGPEFLKWYLEMTVAGVVGALLLRHILWPDDEDVPSDLHYYEVACLNGSWKLAVNSVLAKLLAGKVVTADASAAKTTFQLASSQLPDPTDFENAVLQSLRPSNGLTMTELHHELRTTGQELEESLRHRRILTSNASYAFSARFCSFLIMMTLVGIGVAKVNVGLSRGKPVGFLVLLLIIPSLLAIWFILRPRLTNAARSFLKQQRRLHSQLRNTDEGVSRSPEMYALGAALFGAIALSSTDLLPLKTAWQANRAELGSSGCGTAGCGGSGCGGGCGCGGCGGD